MPKKTRTPAQQARYEKIQARMNKNASSTNKAVTPAAKIELIVINFKTEIKVPFEAFPRTNSLKASLTHKAKTCPPTTNETDKGMYK